MNWDRDIEEPLNRASGSFAQIEGELGKFRRQVEQALRPIIERTTPSTTEAVLRTEELMALHGLWEAFEPIIGHDVGAPQREMRRR